MNRKELKIEKEIKIQKALGTLPTWVVRFRKIHRFVSNSPRHDFGSKTTVVVMGNVKALTKELATVQIEEYFKNAPFTIEVISVWKDPIK